MADDFNQLAAETRWLRRYSSPPNKQNAWVRAAEQVEELLCRSEIADFLNILEKTNIDRRRPFLLAPYLLQVIASVEGRPDTRKMWPVLAQPPEVVRAHFKEAASKSRALAKLLRKGPQPDVNLAPLSEQPSVGELFTPIISAPDNSANIADLSWVLESAAASLHALALRVERPKINRRPAANSRETKQNEMRVRAATLLAQTFRKELSRPYHTHVAKITSFLSGIETDADYVKKAERSMT